MHGAALQSSGAGAGPRDFRSRRRQSRADLTLPGSRPSGGFDVLGGRGTFLLRPGGGSSEHPRSLRQSSPAGFPLAFPVAANGSVAIALICLAATSYVHIDSDEIAVLNKIYGTTSLPGQHIIATNGEKGPQAEILTPGWHPWFLVNVIYQVENKKVVSIPSGKYGFLNAK